METFVPNRKVLFVDDEEGILSAFTSLMRNEDVVASVLQDSTKIGEVLSREGPFAVVLSDMRMPVVDGVALLRQVSRVSPETVRLLVSGYADHEATRRAINEGGISHYLTKPWTDEELRRVVRDSVARYNLASENRHLLEVLHRKNSDLRGFLDGTIAEMTRLLSDMLNNINPQGAEQVERLRGLGRAALSLLPELAPDEIWEIHRALDLFNLGLVVLPAWVQVSLNRAGLGALERFPEARNHHLLAAEMLGDIPGFGGVARVIRLMGKNYDGSGEPLNEPVAGEEIPLGARLLHILCDLDCQTSSHLTGKEVLERMMELPSRYDARLIALILGSSREREPEVREILVGLDGLTAGMVVLADVETAEGRCLLKAGTLVTESMVSAMRKWLDIQIPRTPIRVRLSE